MKKKLILSFLMICFVLLFFSCDNGSSGSKSSEPLIFTGADIDGKSVRIEITRPGSRSVITPQANDLFRILVNSQVVSSGTIMVNGDNLTFDPNSGFLFGGEIIEDENLFISIVRGHSVGIMAITGFADSSNNFTATAANFNSIIDSIKHTPGEYVINLTEDVPSFPHNYIIVN